MECIKGMMAGLVIGMMAGALFGACNSSMIFDAVKQGKKEVRRFKRKYM